ncbi:alcohol dehydrogenase catalytic domain-containing protein [Geodermatophilus chilensis]|jgi:propanol-preferring alcohol dehydrogenase|uniref:alcohol dehydrogenase catalytic domain-containing protein n=1 Tax=Geodermatophilus chilensis TaxID=2035835 RepID=UPI001E2B71E5|nr:alcohol dehydrogenase catalytic domain-containing protein [Geodermatophilus chilensis]
MRAVQYRTIGGGPEVVEVPTPEPGPGQIRLRVTAAGLCHSDWLVMDLLADECAYGLPLTLGHEGAGVVDALGDGVTGAPEVYRRLHEGAVRGRAVVVPGD